MAVTFHVYVCLPPGGTASPTEGSDPADAAPSESRLDKLKAAFKPKEDPSVVALRAEVAELREEVARLSARVEELSAAK